MVLYKELMQSGMNVIFVTYGGKKDIAIAEEYGIDVIANTKRLPIVLYAILLPLLIKRRNIKVDIVKSHQFIGIIPAVMTSAILNVPYIARGGYIPTFFFKQGRKKIFSVEWFKLIFCIVDEWLITHFADIISLPSDEEIQYIQERHPSAKVRCVSIPNWVNTELFHPMSSGPKIRDVIFVGRFEAQKNPLLFLESLRGIDGVRATMIGGGKLFGEIKAYIKKYALDCIVYETRIPNEDLPIILNNHRVAVLPTEFEGGSPKTLLEAMACGLPIVSTDTFGTRNLFLWKESVGILCVLDAKKMSEAIQYLLLHPDVSDVFGANGRAYVNACFSLSATLKKETHLLASLVNHT